MSYRGSVEDGWRLVCDAGLPGLPKTTLCRLVLSDERGDRVKLYGEADDAAAVLGERARQTGWKRTRIGRTGEIHLCPECATANRM